MIKTIRTQSQQLATPLFEKPKELVAWMGAIQAQDYNMSKWAIGVRLQGAKLSDIENALQKGEILRTHVMRPTWHLVAAEDIRWMLQLSKERIKSSSKSRDADLGITEKIFSRVLDIIGKILAGNNHLTRQEIALKLNEYGIKTDCALMIHYMQRAEVEGLVCSGIDKGTKQTYALIDERALPTAQPTKEETLAKLATNYFQSHSPASLQDFAWWSGLSAANCKYAVNLITKDIDTNKFSTFGGLITHNLYKSETKNISQIHFLPTFDEYLISYKDRTHVIDLQHQPKAFTKNGTFYPIIMCDGKIVGAWSKIVKKGRVEVNPVFFENDFKPNKTQLEKAKNRYIEFVSQ